MIRVRIAAASAVVHAGLAAILADASGIVVVPDGMPDDEIEAAPDVVLIDAEIFDEAGEAALEQERGAGVVVLLDAVDSMEAGRLLRVGVRGVIESDAARAAIVAAVHAVAAGLTVVSGAGADAITGDPAERVPTHASGSDQPVTPRETEVLRLLAEGLGNKGIARRLGISEHTVKAHVSSILVKLGAGSRAEAVAIGARHGLILL